MAEYGRQWALTWSAAADLREVLYHVVRFAAAGDPPTTNVASDETAAIALGPVGVLQNKPNTGQAATVAFLGPSKVVAGGTATAGAYWTHNSSGRAVDAGSGDNVIGRGLQTAANDGEIVNVLLTPTFRMIGT